ncbi:hypothetical protein [Acidovorax sp. SUPP2825]|uniref:hypothetical protein n=1 Tax=Acidovorax sp. SUPP2825 TaxID=2920879 RepID=UPI0023DE3A2C|nr:hypothetical protein [Acidovorax sp. SUPP2825]GKS96767.1 hypothetical protein AVAK2825_19550 [Acidovorax sp. SUPP2825]
MAEKTDELSALAGQAAGLETAQEQAAEGQGGAPAAPVQTNAKILAGAFHLGREVSCAVLGLQSPRMVLDDPTLQQLGDVWGAVADKRGWDISAILGDYAAEVAAVMLSITVGVKLMKAAGAELDARERKPEPAPSPDANVG